MEGNWAEEQHRAEYLLIINQLFIGFIIVNQ